MKLILASQSPRRKELMQLLQYPFDIVPSDFDEASIAAETPTDYVQTLALEKAKTVQKTMQENDVIVIGADTIVVQHNRIFGKPKDAQEVVAMLRQLSGDTHHVYTAVALVTNESIHTFYEKTDVTFYSLMDEEIQAYIKTKEPFDKAGSYGIQGYGALFVEKIHGDYFNVVGLPIARLKRELRPFLEGR